MYTEASVINAFAVNCEGVSSEKKVAPLSGHPANPTITVYSDGVREVGCTFLDPSSGSCLADSVPVPVRCIQLFPINNRINSQNEKPDLISSRSEPHQGRMYKNEPPISLDTATIERKCIEFDLSQHALAKVLHRSQSHVSAIMLGKTIGFRTSVDVVYRMTAFFNISPAEILVNPEDVNRLERYEAIFREREKRLQAVKSPAPQ